MSSLTCKAQGRHTENRCIYSPTARACFMPRPCMIKLNSASSTQPSTVYCEGSCPQSGPFPPFPLSWMRSCSEMHSPFTSPATATFAKEGPARCFFRHILCYLAGSIVPCVHATVACACNRAVCACNCSERIRSQVSDPSA